MKGLNNAAFPDGTYRAEIGNRTYDLRFEDGRLFVNDEPVAVSFEPVGEGHFSLILGGRSFAVTIIQANGRIRVILGGREVEVQVRNEQDLMLERFGVGRAGAAAHREVHAPMPGLVLGVHVQPGQPVKAGEGQLVLEAMKMENELKAPADGTVRAVHVKAGDAAVKGQLLVDFE